jgi:hypothetical protein
MVEPGNLLEALDAYLDKSGKRVGKSAPQKRGNGMTP